MIWLIAGGEVGAKKLRCARCFSGSSYSTLGTWCNVHERSEDGTGWSFF